MIAYRQPSVQEAPGSQTGFHRTNTVMQALFSLLILAPAADPLIFSFVWWHYLREFPLSSFFLSFVVILLIEPRYVRLVAQFQRHWGRWSNAGVTLYLTHHQGHGAHASTPRACGRARKISLVQGTHPVVISDVRRVCCRIKPVEHKANRIIVTKKTLTLLKTGPVFLRYINLVLVRFRVAGPLMFTLYILHLMWVRRVNFTICIIL